MEEAVHQLREGLVQGVLTRHAVDGLLSATLKALSTPYEANSTPVFHNRGRNLPNVFCHDSDKALNIIECRIYFS